MVNKLYFLPSSRGYLFIAYVWIVWKSVFLFKSSSYCWAQTTGTPELHLLHISKVKFYRGKRYILPFRKRNIIFLNVNETPVDRQWINEWMMHLCSTFCVLLYTQSALQSCGGGLSSTTTSVQHPLGWCDGCHRTTAPVRSPHTSYRWRGERVIETIKWMGIIRRPWLTRASGGNLARTPGLHPYSLREVPWDF